jgi:predicted alpha/beta-hydrolase family hydrolase
MREYSVADPDAPTLVLAHGAGAGHDHPWMRRVAQRLADRGVRVVTFNFPYIDAGRRLPDREPVLEDAYAAVWREMAASTPGGRLHARARGSPLLWLPAPLTWQAGPAPQSPPPGD